MIGVDPTSEAVIRKLPIRDETRMAILTTDVPWRELYGYDVTPLDRWWSDPAGVRTVLRLCALMGHVLECGLIRPERNQLPFKHLASRPTETNKSGTTTTFEGNLGPRD